jgi:hypothetical protein
MNLATTDVARFYARESSGGHNFIGDQTLASELVGAAVYGVLLLAQNQTLARLPWLPQLWRGAWWLATKQPLRTTALVNPDFTYDH